MYYIGKVPCTKTGYPICCLDSKTCDVTDCRYFVLFPSLGNCVLRVEKSDNITMEEISHALPRYDKKTQKIEGWGVRRQRIDQMEKATLKKLKKRAEKYNLRDMLTTCVELRNELFR